MPVDRFLPIALGICDALIALHRTEGSYGQLSPETVFVCLPTAQVRLLGAACPDALPDDAAPVIRVTHALPYLAPEQTGRISQRLDARSDCYALGVIFYELLTGALPFTARDALEWAHAHVARIPQAPHARNADVPLPLSDIVMKMLEKAPERRYQSLPGLRADLAHCLHEWLDLGAILPFAVGRQDIGGRFRVVHRLYGRDHEIADALAVYQRVAERGASELLLLSGPAGVGKSAVVEALEKQINTRGGAFIAGKFDQAMRQMPYATLCSALSQLVDSLLGSEEPVLRAYRQRIGQAVADNGALLFDLIPQARLLLDAQAPPAPLPPREAQRRLFAALRGFITAFIDDKRPLVIFLDDLQWSDSDTLALLHFLLVSPGTPGLLVIGAYRDNEVDARHPLAQALERIRASSLPVTHIRLAALSTADFAAMIADALGIPPRRARPLAALVHRKTAGIPLCALHFLNRLEREGHLRFDPAGAGWAWDHDAIQAQSYSDNVIDLMLDALKDQLAPAALAMLQYAACIGYVVDLSLLGKICKIPEAEVRTTLRVAWLAGFVELVDRSALRFAHDRLQQAVYASIPQDRRGAMHLEIARCLREALDAGTIVAGRDPVFDLADQFNLGRADIDSEDERRALMALNLRAGAMAKQAGAHVSASHYLDMGLQGLRAGDFDADYPTAYWLHFEQASCCYLLGRTAEAGALLETLLGHTRGVADRARALHLKIELLSALADNKAALATLRECTGLFGITIPDQVSEQAALAEEARFWEALGTRPISSLSSMEDAPPGDAHEFLLDSLLIATPQANMHSAELFHLLVAHAACLSLRHGSRGEAALSYALLGIVCCIRDELEVARQLEDLARQLVQSGDMPVPDRYRAPAMAAIGALLAPYTRPLRAALADLRLAFESALRSDQPVAANLACEYIIEQRCGLGEPLADVQHDLDTRIDFAERTAYTLSRQVLAAWRAYLRLLRGQARRPPSFDADGFDEDQFERQLDASPASPVHFVYYSLKLQARFLFGDRTGAMCAADQAWRHYRFAFSSFQRSEFHFYRALAAAALCRAVDAGSLEGQRLRALLQDDCGRLARWQEHCPENHAARYQLVRAERARVEGDRHAAMDAYVRAIEDAGTHQQRALAHELAAGFCDEEKAPRLAATMLAQAIADCERWGAQARAARLRLRAPAEERAAPPAARDRGLAQDTQLDLLAMARAAQCIANEVTTGRLHETLLRTLLEHVGAESAHLLLYDGRTLHLKESARYQDERFHIEHHAGLTALPDTLPRAIVHYVARSRITLVLDDACREGAFAQDAYFRGRRQCAVLCLPIVRQQDLAGVLYLENTQLAGAFAHANLQVLEWLLAQVAISMENADLYETLQESEARLATVMEHVPASVYMKDLEARYLFVNREFEKTFGVTLADMLHRTDLDHFADAPELAECIRRTDMLAMREGTISIEEALPAAGGATHTFLSVKTPLYRGGQLTGLCGISLDISEQKRARERIEYLAHYDVLTGLPNRNLLTDRIEMALADAGRSGAEVALLVLDVDRFKVINDSLGHRVGDLLLQEMAARLKSCVREGDTVTRLGGDAFVIIAPGLGGGEAARPIAAKIGDRLSMPYRISGHQVTTSVCIGISVFPRDTRSGDTLLQYAEMAMYQAKLQGHKSMRFYDEAMDLRAQERLVMENELRTAIANHDLYLLYQPQVDLRDRHVAGAEALVRWRHPVRGLIPPSRFIPLAEECGLISEITEWAIHQVCTQLRQWMDAGLPPVSLAVNVSARNVQHDDLYHWVESALADARIGGGSLELEMTEGTLMTDMETSIEKLVALKRLGIRTSIDDFGTGYSSLSYLKRLPVDKLKIDQSFVRDIAKDTDDAAITSAIIAMGRQLNLKVIAEGVEDSEAERFLVKHRCDQMQGYLFSPPVSAEAFAALLR
jgi:diguanylate cyclase (GGDEF)-like protein/PAS domain S-box-containing protein